MIMKLATGFAIASLAFAGAACSEPSPPSTDVAKAEIDPPATTALPETDSGFNLSLPGSVNEDTSQNGLNLSFGESQNDDLIIGGNFGGGNFEDSPALDLGIEIDPASDESSADDIIRLPE